MSRLRELVLDITKNDGAYPNCIVVDANEILRYYDERREAVKALRFELREVVYIHRRILNTLRRTFTYRRASQQASMDLRGKVDPETLEKYHRFKSCVSDRKMFIGINSERLYASLALLRCENIALVLKYLECVNTKTPNKEVADVGFIRDVGMSGVAEILAWRLKHFKG